MVLGVRISPFLAAAVMEFHVGTYQTRNTSEEATVKRLTCSFYVDNLATSLESQEGADFLHARIICCDGFRGFELRC